MVDVRAARAVDYLQDLEILNYEAGYLADLLLALDDQPCLKKRSFFSHVYSRVILLSTYRSLEEPLGWEAVDQAKWNGR